MPRKWLGGGYKFELNIRSQSQSFCDRRNYKGQFKKMQSDKRFSSRVGDLKAGQSHLPLVEIPEGVTEGEVGFHQIPLSNRAHYNPLFIIHSFTQQVCTYYIPRIV